MPSITEKLEEIAVGCDGCARDALREAEAKQPITKAEARAWRATAQMIRAVIKDLKGER